MKKKTLQQRIEELGALVKAQETRIYRLENPIKFEVGDKVCYWTYSGRRINCLVVSLPKDNSDEYELISTKNGLIRCSDNGFKKRYL